MSNTKIETLQNQLTLARREIHNLRQQLSTLTHVHQKEIDHIYHKLENWHCHDCQKQKEKSETSVVGETSSQKPTSGVGFKSIGVISTHFPEKRGTPRQPGICHDTIAKLTLSKDTFSNPQHALDGLQEFSHMWILFHFHKNEANHVKAKVAPPRLNGIRTGVFATRSPHRPCPIGMSLVKIDRIMDNIIYFTGVDMVDQTPVFDIKPYIPQYDCPSLLGTLNTRIDRTPQVSSGEPSEGPPPTREIVDGQENDRENQVLGLAPETHEVTFHRRSSSRIGEREAPDGEEEEPAAAGAQVPTPTPSTSQGHVRVPSWIDQASVSRFAVSFKDRALTQLSELGFEAAEKKKIITSVLQEDPRSVYLRERWSGHCYVFRIAELYVSCKFNDSNRSVTVFQILQNERQNDGEE